jgi:SAM-dependent methyltransferase
MAHLRKVTKNKTNLRILNIGVATGKSSELLMQLGQVESVEYDQDCYEFVRDTVKIPIIQGSILALPYEAGTFDLVCAFDVIEHVEHDQLAVSEMTRVCKEQGIVCVTVPAFMFLWSEHDVVNHHFRRYSSKTLKLVFQHENILNLYHSYFNTWLFFPIAAFRLMAGFVRFCLGIIFKQKNQSAKLEDTENTASDFSVMKGGFLNKIFYHIFLSESWFVKRFIRLPVGVSLISTWQKK